MWGFIQRPYSSRGTTETKEARIPTDLAASLEWNREAVFVGLVHYKSRRGELRPDFRVDSVLAGGVARLPAKAEFLQRWAQAASQPKRDPAAALQGQRPAVVLITGVGSVAADDV